MSAVGAAEVGTYKWLRRWFLGYVYLNMKIIFENRDPSGSTGRLLQPSGRETSCEFEVWTCWWDRETPSDQRRKGR